MDETIDKLQHAIKEKYEPFPIVSVPLDHMFMFWRRNGREKSQ